MAKVQSVRGNGHHRSGSRIARQGDLEHPAAGKATATVGRVGIRPRAVQQLAIDDPLIKEFRGSQAKKTIDRMLIDPVISGAVERNALLLRAPEWHLDPGGAGAPIDVAFRDFCLANLSRLPGGFSSVVGETAEMLGWGFALFEQIFARDGTFWVWDALAPRDQRTIDGWNVDAGTGVVRGVFQVFPESLQRVEIPGWKMLHFRTAFASGRPEGRTLLRGAFLPWTDKQELRRVIKTGVRRDLTGLLTIEVPPEITTTDADPAQKAALEDAKQLGQDIERDLREFLIIPSKTNQDGTSSGWDVRLMTSGGRRTLDLEAIFKGVNQEIAIAIFAEYMLLGTGDVGSWSLHSDKTTMAARALGAWLKGISTELREKGFRTLRALNPAFHAAALPVAQHDDIEAIPLGEWITAATQATGAGVVTPDRGLEAEARQRLKVPTLQGEEEL